MAPQASSNPTTLIRDPATASAEAVLYLPEIYTQDGNRLPCDILIADLSRDAVINDISTGQYEDVIRVTAIDRVSGRCWDASKLIAHAVLHQVLDHYENIYDDMPRWLLDFVEEHLGVRTVHAIQCEAAA